MFIILYLFDANYFQLEAGQQNAGVKSNSSIRDGADMEERGKVWYFV